MIYWGFYINRINLLYWQTEHQLSLMNRQPDKTSMRPSIDTSTDDLDLLAFDVVCSIVGTQIVLQSCKSTRDKNPSPWYASQGQITPVTTRLVKRRQTSPKCHILTPQGGLEFPPIAHEHGTLAVATPCWGDNPWLNPAFIWTFKTRALVDNRGARLSGQQALAPGRRVSVSQ